MTPLTPQTEVTQRPVVLSLGLTTMTLGAVVLLGWARQADRRIKSISKPMDFEQFSGAGQKLGFYWLLLNHPQKLEK